jgi:hypothetical protein
MKQTKIILILFFIFFIKVPLFCQTWERIYFLNSPTFPYTVMEGYDKGFIIGGGFYYNDGTPRLGLIIKTDVNGEVLWYKTIGQNNDGTGVFNIDKTNDGGYILSGATKKTDPWGDSFIMKLNSCGENEWCRIFTSMPDSFDYVASVHQIPGGYIALMRRGGEMIKTNHIMLIRLDEDGDLIWQQLYAQSDSLISGADCNEMIVTADNHYLISGDCYYPDSGTTGPRYLKPLIIKVDSTGTLDWKLPWSYINGESFYGQAFRSILDNQGFIYSGGRHIEDTATPPGDRPTVIKTDMNGNEIAYYDIHANTWQAIISTLNWFADSTIALGGAWLYQPASTAPSSVIKVDRFFNLLDSITIFSDYYTFSDALTTFDNKLLLVAPIYTNMYHTYAWKLNSNLEYDSIYTYPYVYDSLCSHPIVSDTIPLDCVIVGIDEPFKDTEAGKILVYPNPASEKIHIIIPDQLKIGTKNQIFQVTTVYHQWKSVFLEIYDLFGRRIFSKEIPKSEKEVVIDVSSWPKVMYVVRLVYNKEIVGIEKVLIK